ncbi:MAG: glutamate racemase [Melioribacteraceae bacterium]|nr:glutamate racemase [Melioribacteraceae bacterium]WKZ68829.1 MAG: glutamate racemase [Melioribacteraceae bacterium]
MNKTNPVGIFDSGIGGLTVVKQMDQFIPNENMIYFGDTARVPYGNKSNETVIEYAIQDTKFLLKKNVKMIVVACNTVSSVALNKLRENFEIPIVGMIEPGAKSAIENTTNGKVGVIGTYATINNKAYSAALKKLDKKLKIYEKACPLFVPLAEEGMVNHPATKLIVKEYLDELKKQKIDTLILGCTHYPLLSNVIQEVMGDKVTLIDSGVAAASVVENYLFGRGLRNESHQIGKRDFYVSDLPAKFKTIADTFLGRHIEHLTKVDLEELI